MLCKSSVQSPPAMTVKLTDADVRKIRELHAKGVPNKTLAAQFWVTPTWISLLVNDHRRAHVMPPETEGPTDAA